MHLYANSGELTVAEDEFDGEQLKLAQKMPKEFQAKVTINQPSALDAHSCPAPAAVVAQSAGGQLSAGHWQFAECAPWNNKYHSLID
jgi:hypothetical protein